MNKVDFLNTFESNLTDPFSNTNFFFITGTLQDYNTIVYSASYNDIQNAIQNNQVPILIDTLQSFRTGEFKVFAFFSTIYSDSDYYGAVFTSPLGDSLFIESDTPTDLLLGTWRWGDS